MKHSNKKIFVKLGLMKNAYLLCCAVNRTAQRISIYASRFGSLRALHLSIFEQPLNKDFFNFVNLNDFSSGCNCLALSFSTPTADFRKDDFLAQHRFPFSILIPTTQEHRELSTYKLMDMSLMKKLMELIKIKKTVSANKKL
jgi:hypothetical protein